MMNRSKAEFERIEKDKKKKDKEYFCVSCGGVATQTALFKIEGAIIVERYCDNCAKSVD
jgi:transcription elongation factor Elf1